MAISPRHDVSFSACGARLAAGAWTELGVSGWSASHSDWAVDPEPLILFTAWLGDRDARLRDEATDWCVRQGRYLSRSRLKNLLGAQPDEVQVGFGEFSATVSLHARPPWPGGTAPRKFQLTNRSVLPDLSRPALVWLRLRAIFGLTARAEIIRVLLGAGPSSMSLAELAKATSYTKRNVADECASLAEGGILATRKSGNRFTFSLVDRSALESVVGQIAPLRPDWTSLFAIVRDLIMLDELATTSSSHTMPVHAKKAAMRIADDFGRLGLNDPFRDVFGAELWPRMQAWAAVTLPMWAAGDW
jgi:hypothetical protein